QAYERLLERRPALRGEVRLMLVSVSGAVVAEAYGAPTILGRAVFGASGFAVESAAVSIAARGVAGQNISASAVGGDIATDFLFGRAVQLVGLGARAARSGVGAAIARVGRSGDDALFRGLRDFEIDDAFSRLEVQLGVPIGVPPSSLARVVARLRGLRISSKNVVARIEAFGSRAGSTFRRPQPRVSSDLDFRVEISPQSLLGRNRRFTTRTLQEIRDDFFSETGFEINFFFGPKSNLEQPGPFIELFRR
ncbi:MAG: hypothetical protein AAFX94_11935, partial [Myxococcota bacterium]